MGHFVPETVIPVIAVLTVYLLLSRSVVLGVYRGEAVITGHCDGTSLGVGGAARVAAVLVQDAGVGLQWRGTAAVSVDSEAWLDGGLEGRIPRVLSLHPHC